MTASHPSFSNDGAPSPNLYLVGFMGTGKSAVGRSVAQRLRMQFIDSDHQIEVEQGRSIPTIFAEQGESYFRQLERQFVEKGHPSNGCVVACGGGLVVQPGMADALKARGIVVCLFATPETILQRTSSSANRPLLNVENPAERIRELLAEREPHYLKAGACIITDRRPMQDVVAHVERHYRRFSKRFRPASQVG